MPSPASSGVGFIGLFFAGLAVLVTFSLHKIEEGELEFCFVSKIIIIFYNKRHFIVGH